MKYNIQKQHERKKYHAIERIMLLLDKGSFCEIGSGMVNYGYNSGMEDIPIEYDGVITGYGKIEGQVVYVFAQDFTVKGGTLGLRHGQKIARIIKQAIKSKCPVIGIYDSGGARIEEGINALAGCSEMLYYNTLASGYIPQISVIAGPCAGAAAYSPAISDFIFSVDKIGYMFITGPDVVKNVTGEECSYQDLGGAKVHSSVSGVSHFCFSNEKECFATVRKLINLLPACCKDKHNITPDAYNDRGFNGEETFPTEVRTAYDIKQMIRQFADPDSFLEVHEKYALSMVVGFAKLCGKTIGIVANQPKYNCGSIDCDSSDKAARFVRFCDCFNIPVITFVDTPGYLPGKDQEHYGIIRHGAKLLFAYSEATTLKITVIVGKAYGGAYIAMGSKQLGADYVYALPRAQVAVMGAEGAISILHRKQINEIDKNMQEQFIKGKAAEYSEKYMNSVIAVREGYVDEVINVSQMRKRIYDDMVSFNKKEEYFKLEKKHGNIPL
ncbi:MAG: Propionyl-CoA carboxylase [Anaerocolumna sp.]|jgi:propionyl-CoA carboxylase beta chain|nr:Propionyl-CoA carboxylase [Anaerocolumna sp.]